MRKTLSGLMAALFMLIGFAETAAAETEDPKAPETEQEASSSPVECTFHNFTYPTVPEEHAYRVGDEINFEISLVDPEATVANIVFFVGTEAKGGKLQEGTSRSVTWQATAPGQWIVGAQLFDAAGQEIIPTGDCDGAVTVQEAYIEPAHPEAPDVEEPVPTPEPEPVDNTCKDDDPSTLTPVNNPDGTVSYYSPDGVLCADLLPQVPVVNAPVQPVAAASAQPAAQMAELPHTGTGLTITAIIGFILLVGGCGFTLFARRFVPDVRPLQR